MKSISDNKKYNKKQNRHRSSWEKFESSESRHLNFSNVNNTLARLKNSILRCKADTGQPYHNIIFIRVIEELYQTQGYSPPNVMGGEGVWTGLQHWGHVRSLRKYDWDSGTYNRA